MQVLSSLLAVSLLASTVVAHPGGHEAVSRSDIQKRGVMAKRCAGAAAAMNEKRWNKRQAKRDLEARRGNATFEITTQAPYYDVLQNDTCVLTPTVTEGPVCICFHESKSMLIISSTSGHALKFSVKT
jgi:hypothetical protein